MKEYTAEEKVKVGKVIADILQLRKSREYKNRYNTAWGTKTAQGIFEVVKRLSSEVEAGTLWSV